MRLPMSAPGIMVTHHPPPLHVNSSATSPTQAITRRSPLRSHPKMRYRCKLFILTRRTL